MTKKLIIGILVGGALGATVAYYRYRFLEHFRLQPTEPEEEEPFVLHAGRWTGDPRTRFQLDPVTETEVEGEVRHG